jgi:hypothetical protein
MVLRLRRKADAIVIHGERGRLTLSTFGNAPLELETENGSERFSLPNPLHIQQPFIQTMVDALQGRGECASTGITAARTSLVMDLALESYYGSRGRGFWLEPARWPGRQPR